METYSQSSTGLQGPTGQITVELFDKSGTPSSVSRVDQKFSVRATLRLEDVLEYAKEYVKLVNLRANIYMQSLGSGQSYQFPSVEKPWEVGRKNYEFEVSVPAGKLDEGVYRVAVVIRGIVIGQSVPLLTWYTDGPVFEMYS